ncbi:hypothetical protein M758_6G162300 [Ceratodon purpureus]|uniref:Uncharacterized protein n=1 Tax=Ceratodon purpureus TaxID=3225 RepID=A0A8T0HFH4_CERPU|nr:hypothetical protein KC19_6G168700 [Ceratodon purpureus]KAG0614250.1 hypothetical protein M758_6G162300 [Ceratodon purpureus]
MATAAVCGPSTALVCSSRPGSERFSVSQSLSSRLAIPCAGLRRDLRLTGRSSQERCRGSVGIKSRRRVVGIRAGLPVISSVPVVGPLANAIFNPVLLFIVYAAGAFRFYSGFQKTTYADSSATKISMTALWPVLFVASKAYRDNFKKAIS